MANMTIEENDRGSLVLEGGKYKHGETLTFAGADTFAAGTILARDSVSKKLVLFAKGGSSNENGIPKAVLTYAVTAEGAGDVGVDVLVGGVVAKERLIIDADGDDSNIDAVVLDQLRAYGIEGRSVKQLAKYDNNPDS